MTNTTATETKGVIRPSQFPRTANTLRLVHLMEESHRLEIAGRITELRERSRFTQPQIADKLGLTLRGYQKIEEKGTTKYERVEEIAAIHDADPEWIWEGREKGETPDVLSALSGADPEVLKRLDRIEEALAELIAEVADLGTEREKETAPERSQRRRRRDEAI